MAGKAALRRLNQWPQEPCLRVNGTKQISGKKLANQRLIAIFTVPFTKEFYGKM